MAKLNIKSPWDQKYLREQPFMAFGSMMNAYGNINQGKGLSMEDFEIATEKIFALAKKYAEKAFEDANGDDANAGVNIPMK